MYGYTHVERDEGEIHPSHTFGEKTSSIFAPLNTPRFSSVRECTRCGAEIQVVNTGTWAEDDLLHPCIGDI